MTTIRNQPNESRRYPGVDRRPENIRTQFVSRDRRAERLAPVVDPLGQSHDGRLLDGNAHLGRHLLIGMHPIPDALAADAPAGYRRQSPGEPGNTVGLSCRTCDRFHAGDNTTCVDLFQPDLFAVQKHRGYKDRMNVGGRVKYARKQLGWTQVELSQRSGVSQAAVSALEKRDSQWTKFLVELAGALGVNERWLAHGDGDIWRQADNKQSTSPASTPVEAIDPTIIEYILDALDERGARQLSNHDLSQLIAGAYSDMLASIRDDYRDKVRRIVSQTVQSPEHSSTKDENVWGTGSERGGR